MLLWLLACVDPPATHESADPGPPRGGVQFAFPLAEPEKFAQVVGVDHDPEVHEGIEQLICLDYNGRPFPWCYDEHDGNDYLLEGDWAAMDAGSVQILAAADGVVVETDDGHYDRCHGDISSGGNSCDGYPMAANFVIVAHEGGVKSRYWHMMSGSVAVSVGDAVRCGDVLGVVGSSGNSSQPHLHFEVEGADGSWIDPYAGPNSQPETWWLDQGDPEGLPGAACP